jgi:hypothetical protein
MILQADKQFAESLGISKPDTGCTHMLNTLYVFVKMDYGKACEVSGDKRVSFLFLFCLSVFGIGREMLMFF